jgi:uncharacterized membrane protein (DUF373 family)
MLRMLQNILSDDGFGRLIHRIEVAIAKILSLLMLGVISVTVIDLIKFLAFQLTAEPIDFFTDKLLKIFGLFLNVLIALELLENLTAYLHKDVSNQVKLVIVTALIAVARKLIILDLEKTAGLNLIALGVAVLALSVSYWLIHYAAASNAKH